MRLLLNQIRTGGSPRKGKSEYCAVVRRAFDPNAAFVCLDDPSGNRQDGYELAFYFTREDGAVVGQHAGSMSTAVTAWYPSWVWRAGETVRIETPVLAVGRGRGVLVAVVTPSGDPAATADRVAPIAGDTVGPQEILQDRTLLKFFAFP